jgi:hypothetical protein
MVKTLMRYFWYTATLISLAGDFLTLLLWMNQGYDGVVFPLDSKYYFCASYNMVGVGAPFGHGMWGIHAALAVCIFSVLPIVALIRLFVLWGTRPVT